ncbi:MAG: Dabb family protein [Pseudomonadales bacterium]
MILHTVVFRLSHKLGSLEEREFLHKIAELAYIPGVEDFKLLRQISDKNDFDFGLSMEFASHQTYDAYNEHPMHQTFVNEVWLQEVADFMEIDFQPLND